MDQDPPFAARLRSSQLILRIVADGGERISVGEIVDGLRDRAGGLLLILLALGSLLPGPPGMATVLGILMAVFAGQLVVGQSGPRLPSVVRRRSFARARLIHLLQRACPRLARLECHCRPRWPRIVSRLERIAGGLILVLAVAIALPIPFSGAPPALAVIVLALGILERDGAVLLLGLLVSAAALGVVALLATTYLGTATRLAATFADLI